jgi:diguanylate cyclase (GGDEF)-like protein
MNLVTSYDKAKNETKSVQKFLEASKKGWQYALENEDETIEIIHKKYNHNKSIEALKYEANEIKHLMLLDLYDIGEVSRELIIRLQKQLLRNGKISSNQKNSITFFEDILNGENIEGLFFTQKEMDFLNKKGTIKLCTDPDWLPFEGLEDGKYVGMIADYFDLIREKSNLKIEIYPTKSWDESMEAIKTRKCDIIGSASPTPKRLKYMNFTDAYMKSPIVLVTTMDKSFIDSIEDVKDKKLGISKGYAIAEILKKEYPGINIVDVENINDGLKKVESGKLYGYIDNLSVTVANIQQSFHGILKVSSRLNETDDLTIGSRNDEPLLNEIFQKVIKSIDQSKVRDILNRWVSVKESVNIDYTFFWRTLGFIAAVFVFFLFYSYQLKQNNTKLTKLSREDALTKVGNRLKLNEVLDDMQKYTQRYKISCGIMILDIDDFKKVNDTYGHLVGDDVLKQFAQILSQNIRETDKIGRWGGEEFLIVCPNTKKEDLRKVAEGLRTEIETHDFANGIDKLTASFGLSMFDEAKDIEQVLNQADKNLYKAKSNGKNQVF